MISTSAKIGILSIGEMGMGIAKLLRAKGFAVATTCRDRSQDTIDRAQSARVIIYPTDDELVHFSDIILSVVPPGDAVATAQRVFKTLEKSSSQVRATSTHPLYFADMNAIAPSTVRQIARLFESTRSPVYLVDGSIIGGPPSTKANSNDWDAPKMYMSGPHNLTGAVGWGPALMATLCIQHISCEIGAASGLKMCFASMTKGYTAIATQAFTSARRMGVLRELQDVLTETSPARAAQTEKALIAMAPKAYRWVHEMEEISKTHVEESGFHPELFLGVAGVYRSVAHDTVLGQEKIGDRKRGTTAEDIAKAMSEGMEQNGKR